jgi:glucan phosphorylase
MMNDATPRTGEAGRGISDAKTAIKEKAADLAHSAKQQIDQQYEQKMQGVTGEVGHLASALRRAGQQLRDENGATIAASIADRMAMRLDTINSSVANKDLDQIVADVERFARGNPAVFLGGAAALGFLAARFLKSSSGSSAMHSMQRREFFTSTLPSSADPATGSAVGFGPEDL